MSKITVTAALPYANGPVHIGHLAGVYIPADIYVRYLRNAGKNVIFVCGSDEHGVPITLRAKKEGISPQEVVDRYHALIGKSFADFGISFDIYSRTSKEIHHETAQSFFSHLFENGRFSEEVTEQFFDEQEQQFLADRYIVGTCPICANENAYGDQCEKCGSTLSPDELKNPRSALSGNAPIKKSTKNWYLPLDQLQTEFLNDWIHSKIDWKSNVLGQCKSWLQEGLKPRAMTRDLDWGIAVPLPDLDGKVLYVWFEAPIGYISATRELKPLDWKDWWSGDSEIIHFIGKDNIVFHCIIFPAMLYSMNQSYALPKNVPGNEFLNLEGNKISTSRNWAVWLNEYLEEFPHKQDELRYVLTSIIPETKDSEFTWKDYQTKIDSELVSIFGNFANRILVLFQKYYNGIVPEKIDSDSELIQTAKNQLTEIIEKICTHIEQFKFRDAQQELMNFARVGNKFLAETEPWKLIKTDPQATNQCLDFGLQILKNLSYLCEPFLPFTHQKLGVQLNLIPYPNEIQLIWEKRTLLPGFHSGHKLNAPEILFQKIENHEIENQINKLKTTEVNTSQNTNSKPMIQYDDFAKMDLRIAEITHAEKVEKADKLLKIELKMGSEKRTVVSGIAQHFTPEECLGKQVLYLANLAPRTLRGIESQGMILMAEDTEKKLHFVSPINSVDSGSTVS